MTTPHWPFTTIAHPYSKEISEKYEKHERDKRRLKIDKMNADFYDVPVEIYHFFEDIGCLGLLAEMVQTQKESNS